MSAGVLPQIPSGELTTLSRSLGGFKGPLRDRIGWRVQERRISGGK